MKDKDRQNAVPKKKVLVVDPKDDGYRGQHDGTKRGVLGVAGYA